MGLTKKLFSQPLFRKYCGFISTVLGGTPYGLISPPKSVSMDKTVISRQLSGNN